MEESLMKGEEERLGGVELRVLLVDDSPVERRIVEGLFKSTGDMFQVITVDSGRRAMEILGLNEHKTESPDVVEHKVDIILTDYCMPEMTGYDLLKAVKNFDRTIPVIIMSSENEPQRINRCLAIGAEDFIIKPLQTNDVLRLKNYARRSAISPRNGTKRKMTAELMAENGATDRRPRLTGLAVA
ncbi:two-component response regulator ORR1-like isoform X2 [Zingiber officinale]|uniref:two-component response regulator ORR1-like isoform X2 n=1 Tax=Zingiber officinale TaxID=94328 RepID=UPI001C4B0DBA|nr:two-component response regulator ORR1-like isoform X2 [Zingiber officinale]XP_042441367.1 two-component response regulator ORR1-like isoform X2 [Zingiber officinale]